MRTRFFIQKMWSNKDLLLESEYTLRFPLNSLSRRDSWPPVIWFGLRPGPRCEIRGSSLSKKTGSGLVKIQDLSQ